MKKANQTTEQDKCSDCKKMSVNIKSANSMGYSLGILTKEIDLRKLSFCASKCVLGISAVTSEQSKPRGHR